MSRCNRLYPAAPVRRCRTRAGPAAVRPLPARGPAGAQVRAVPGSHRHGRRSATAGIPAALSRLQRLVRRGVAQGADQELRAAAFARARVLDRDDGPGDELLQALSAQGFSRRGAANAQPLHLELSAGVLQGRSARSEMQGQIHYRDRVLLGLQQRRALQPLFQDTLRSYTDRWRPQRALRVRRTAQTRNARCGLNRSGAIPRAFRPASRCRSCRPGRP